MELIVGCCIMANYSVSRRQALAGIASTGALGLAGCIGGGGDSGSGKGTVKMGIIGPMSNLYGKSFKQSGQMFTERTDSSYDWEIVYRDNQLNPEKTREVATALIDRERVDFLGGVVSSASALPLQEKIAGDGPVFINFASNNKKLSNKLKDDYDQYKYWFGNGTITEATRRSFKAAIEDVVLPQSDVEKIAVLAEEHNAMPPQIEAANKAIEQAGGEVGSAVRFPLETNDFRPYLSTLEENNVDWVIPFIAVSDSTSLVNQYWDTQPDFAMAGPELTVSSAAKKAVGDNVLTMSNMLRSNVDAPVTEETEPFMKAWRDKFNTTPKSGVAYAYGGLDALANALEKAGSKQPDDVVSALESTVTTTPFGHFDYYGRDSDHPHFLKYGSTDTMKQTFGQWQEIDGEIKQVYLHPSEWADADGEQTFVTPDWTDL
jgi:branched-chain amino acid transport system substrate-binding protein